MTQKQKWDLLCFGSLQCLYLYLCFVLSSLTTSCLPTSLSQVIIFFFLCMVLSHWILFCSNPGIVRHPRLRTCEDPKRYCNTCRVQKSIHIHHCSRCNTCVEHLDHHCFWIANCVGKQNRKLFVLFLFYALCLVFLLTGVCALLAIELGDRIIYTTYMQWSAPAFLFWGIIFGILTGGLFSMLLEQIFLLSNHWTKIYVLQHRDEILQQPNIHRCSKTNLSLYFGNYPWEWFWPYQNFNLQTNSNSKKLK